jgi:hypothetical protein
MLLIIATYFHLRHITTIPKRKAKLSTNPVMPSTFSTSMPRILMALPFI